MGIDVIKKKVLTVFSRGKYFDRENFGREFEHGSFDGLDKTKFVKVCEDVK
jgi:hypothetical protein